MTGKAAVLPPSPPELILPTQTQQSRKAGHSIRQAPLEGKQVYKKTSTKLGSVLMQ